MQWGGAIFIDFILEISSLYFWIFGNNGLWYISVTALLYILFPFLYAYVFKGNVKWRFACLLVVFYAVGFGLYYLAPAYYEITYHGFTQMPCFVWGIIFGYIAFNGIKIRREWLFFLLLVMATVLLNVSGHFRPYCVPNI